MPGRGYRVLRGSRRSGSPCTLRSGPLLPRERSRLCQHGTDGGGRARVPFRGECDGARSWPRLYGIGGEWAF